MKKFLKNNSILILILWAGLLVRFSFFKSIDKAITISDTPTYVDGAINLYRHFWISEYRPPVYLLGIILMGILSAWENLDKSIMIMQLAISAANIVFIYKLTLEAFEKKALACITAFVVAVSFRIYCWDFIILTENMAMFLITLLTYYLVLYLKYKNPKHITLLSILFILAVFTKPFFLLLPPAVVLILLLKFLIFKENGLKAAAKKLGTGLAVLLILLLTYSSANYLRNGFFGISSIGSVNSFGKILQYQMEDLGSNPKLISDIKTAFQTEKPEYKVNDEYLEPWHFIGTYEWNTGHYQEISRFAKEIILKHPLQYITKSVQLTMDLLVLHSPFKDFIADAALIKANHPHVLMLKVRKFTDIVDSFYPLLVLGIAEVLSVSFIKRKDGGRKDIYLLAAVLCMILYHYIISAFLSYGDYCRLLAPCHPLIYVIICLYIYRIITFVVSMGRKTFFKTTSILSSPTNK